MWIGMAWLALAFPSNLSEITLHLNAEQTKPRCPAVAVKGNIKIVIWS